MTLSKQLFKENDSENKKNHQLTFRFSSKQIQNIEELSEASGISLAAAARRLVKQGLQEVDHR